MYFLLTQSVDAVFRITIDISIYKSLNQSYRTFQGILNTEMLTCI